MIRLSRLALLLTVSNGVAFPAMATELFGGIYSHAVSTPFSLEGGRERGVDLMLGIRGGKIISGLGLQPYAFGALNSAGDTSYAAAGLSWRFGKTLYVRPGIGLAIHNGSTDRFDRPDRIALGSRILFEPEVGVGYQLNPRTSVEANWIHMSQGQVFSRQNPGIDNIGARANFAF
jgi:lipid A 3-O-deacylase